MTTEEDKKKINKKEIAKTSHPKGLDQYGHKA